MRFLVPTVDEQDWRARLADPLLHWQPSRSAWELARSWERAVGFPAAVAAALVATAEPSLTGLAPVEAIVEHVTPLTGGGRGSQADILVMATGPVGRVVVCVEGKAGESFDKTTEQWLDVGNPKGRRERIAALATEVGLDAIDPTIRYQLVHRSAAAVIEARSRHAADAVMLVHAFGADTTSSRLDFDLWVDTLVAAHGGRQNAVGGSVDLPDGLRLHLVWAADVVSGWRFDEHDATMRRVALFAAGSLQTRLATSEAGDVDEKSFAADVHHGLESLGQLQATLEASVGLSTWLKADSPDVPVTAQKAERHVYAIETKLLTKTNVDELARDALILACMVREETACSAFVVVLQRRGAHGGKDDRVGSQLARGADLPATVMWEAYDLLDGRAKPRPKVIPARVRTQVVARCGIEGGDGKMYDLRAVRVVPAGESGTPTS